MGLAERLLPEAPPAQVPELSPEQLEPLRFILRTWLDDARRARPEPDTPIENALLERFWRLGLLSMRTLGRDYVVLMRMEIGALLDDLVRKELETAEVERKLALRHLEQATNTLGVLMESLAETLESVGPESYAALFDDKVLSLNGFAMNQNERAVVRFQMDVFIGLDVMDAPLEELTFWAFRAVRGARKVAAMPVAAYLGGLRGELARARTRQAWRDWDESDVAEELAPWPTPASSR